MIRRGWIKRFPDGLEVGSDRDVSTKTASWTKGRLDNMIGAEVHYDGFHISMHGPGVYWESEDYEIEIGGKYSRPVSRRIQKKIDPIDSWVFIWTGHQVMHLEFSPFRS